MKAPGVALALTTLGLGACQVGPTYSRPAVVQAPDRWREAGSSDVFPDRDWWKTFRSPELDRLIDQAAKANFDLQAAVARVREADAQARISGAPLLPSLTANPSVEQGKQNVPRAEKYIAYQVTGQVSYEVDFWGKNRSTFNAARENAIAARFDREVVRLTTAASTAQAYFQVLSLRDQMKVAQDEVNTAQAILDGLRKEFDAGIVTQLDVAQQETEVATLTAAIPPLQQQQAQALDALAILLGETPEKVAVTTASLDLVTVPKVEPGMPSKLLARRPDVREAEAALIVANYDIQNARAQFFPDLSLTAVGGAQSDALSRLFTPQGVMYDLLAQAAQPIFEGGRLTGQLKYSRAKYAEQLADYGKAVVSAFSDAEDNLAGVQRTSQALAQREAALVKARATLQMALTQFRVGTVNQLNILADETAVFTNETAYAQARLAQFQAIVGLYKALGGGWSDGEGPPLPDAEARLKAGA